MKKIVFALFAAMLCISAQAQLRTSRTFFKQDHRATEWIIRAGLSINNMAGTDAEGMGSKTGFDVDLGFNKYFGQTNLYWGMELGVGTRGCSMEYDGYKSDGMAYNVKYSPFTIGYKFPIGESIKIDPHVGGYLSYDFAGDKTDNDFDAGIQAGIGLWYGRVNLDFMYQRGFVNCMDDNYYDQKAYTSNFLIRVGYAF